ncbi:MAG: AEC family transporter [Gammaproteobacteria bacterium]|nr:AEC family transporter [Gammaproteobacteria bacterium]
MTVAVAMTVTVVNLLLMPIQLSIVDISHAQHKNGFTCWLSCVKRVASNPIILANSEGLAISLVSPPLPEFVEQSLDILSRASAALALLYIGASLALADTKKRALLIICAATMFSI